MVARADSESYQYKDDCAVILLNSLKNIFFPNSTLFALLALAQFDSMTRILHVLHEGGTIERFNLTAAFPTWPK